MSNTFLLRATTRLLIGCLGCSAVTILPACHSVEDDLPLTVYIDGDYQTVARCYAEKVDSGEDREFLTVTMIPHDTDHMIRLKAATSEGWRTEIWEVDLSEFSPTITRVDARGAATIAEAHSWARRTLEQAKGCGPIRQAP
jgi:hypothetical protein